MRAWCMLLAAGAEQNASQNASSEAIASNRSRRCSFSSSWPARSSSAARFLRFCSEAGREASSGTSSLSPPWGGARPPPHVAPRLEVRPRGGQGLLLGDFLRLRDREGLRLDLERAAVLVGVA